MSATTRSQEVAAVLRTEILSGQYRAGERLPSERDLAARFDTNRGAVREALKQLEQLGLIDIQPGGVRVLPIEEATLEVLRYLMELGGYPDPKLVDDYLQVFKMITAMSAQQTIVAANDEQLAFIAEHVDAMKAAPTDRERMREGWTALSECFLTVSNNLVVRLIANGLKEQLLDTMQAVAPKPAIDKQRMSKILNGLARAVKNRDPDKMGEFVGHYFDWVREITAKSFADVQSQSAVGS